MLRVRNLNRTTVDNQTSPLISDVSIEVAQGACAVISGKSGSGKTVLLRALADLDENQGDVSLNDRPRSSIRAPDWRRRMCYVPAEPGWWSDTIEDHFSDMVRAKKWAARFGLGADVFANRVSRLSTGERQRLALVRALILEPDVLLLDEPTAALDPDAVSHVETALKEFMQKGGSVVLVTHDRAQGQRMGARFYVMHSGHLTPMERDG